MYADSREFKIEEKIAAIKKTMVQLGTSIKAGPETTRKLGEGMKNSYSMEDLKSGADLLTSPAEEDPPSRTPVPTDRAPVASVRLSDAMRSSKQSVDLTLDKRGMEGKSPELWELNVLLDYEKDKVLALERRLAAKERTAGELNSDVQRLATAVQAGREELAEVRAALDEERGRSKRELARWQAEARDAEDRVEKMKDDWDTLLEKHRALEAYMKSLESRRDVEDVSARIQDLESQRVSLITENASLTQRLQSQDREIDLLKRSIEQHRSTEKDTDRALSTREQEVVELKREKVALLKEIDALQQRDQRPFEYEKLADEIRILRNENVRLVKDLQRATQVDAESEKSRQVDQLLLEVQRLKAQKSRVRSRSTGQEAPRRKDLKRSKSAYSRKANIPQLRIRREPVETPQATASTRRTAGSQALGEVMEMLGVTEVGKTVEVCRAEMRDLAALRKFVGNLAVLIRDCSPPDSIPRQASLKFMWKWVKRLVEEYMRIRKSDSEEVLQQLRTLLRAKSNAELVRNCTRQTADLQSLETVVGKLKVVLGLSPRVALEAIDEAISAMLATS